MYDYLFKVLNDSTDKIFLEFRRLLSPKRLQSRSVNGERCFSVGNAISLLDIVTKNLARNEARNVASDVRDERFDNSRERERKREGESSVRSAKKD